MNGHSNLAPSLIRCLLYVEPHLVRNNGSAPRLKPHCILLLETYRTVELLKLQVFWLHDCSGYTAAGTPTNVIREISKAVSVCVCVHKHVHKLLYIAKILL